MARIQSQKKKERSGPAVAAETDSIDLASSALAQRPANLDATESLKLEKGVIAGGAALRTNASQLLEGVKIASQVKEQIISNMQGERPDWHDQLLLQICNTLHAESVPLFSDPERSGLQAPPIRDRASYVGCTHFCDVLIRADAALAEELLLFALKKKVDPALVVPRLEHFMLEHANSSLYPLGALLGADADEANSLGASYLLRGMLKPYLQIAQSVPEERSFFGFLSRDPKSPEALSDLVISKHIARFLNDFLESAFTKARKAKTERDQIAEAESWADEKLQTIFNTLKNEYDLLNTIEVYVDNKKALSVYDLALIARRLPRGVTWGRCANFPAISELAQSPYPHNNFEPFDLKIMFSAIAKTTKSDGVKLCGDLGLEIRRAIEKSYSISTDGKNSPEFKAAIQTVFSNALGRVFGDLLAK